MAFKGQRLIKQGKHMSCHVYTRGLNDLSYVGMSTQGFEIVDTYPRINGEPIWWNANVEEWEAIHSPNEGARRRDPYGGTLKAGEPDEDGFQRMDR